MPLITLVRDEDEAGTMSPLANTALDREALFAAVGLGPILAGRPTLHKYQWQKAANLPKEIRRRVLAFIASDAFHPANDVPDFDYGEALKYVSQDGLTPKQADALHAKVPDPQMAEDLGVQAIRIL